MRKFTSSRRRFLRDLGVSAAALPFVSGLESLFVRAAAAAPPKKRFIFMCSPNGTPYGNWRVATPGADLDISDGSAFAAPGHVLNPLQKNASHLLILDRLSLVGARPEFQSATTAPDRINHPSGEARAMGNLLTGQVLVGGLNTAGSSGLGNGISIDQALATTFFAGSVRFPSLEIGVQVNENLTDRFADKRVSYDGPSMPRAPVNDPFALFNRVFAGVAGATFDDRRRALDKSVLDGVLDDFASLQPRLSAADRQLLQRHADAVRSIEGQLAGAATCQPPTPGAPAMLDVTNPVATHLWSMTLANFPAVDKLMIDIMVEAVICGLTNVVTFMWFNAESDLPYPWLVPPILKGDSAMNHTRDPDLVPTRQWYAGRFNEVINRLRAVPESGAGGTVLDNSLLMWSSCVGEAASHHSDNMPIVLAGTNGGFFRNGRCLRFNDVFTADPVKDQNTIGAPDLSNNDLMVSILNSFGSTAQTFGDPRFCKGPLPGVKA
jgi:hypothetical protein